MYEVKTYTNIKGSLMFARFPKKCCLRPQNNSRNLEPEKLPKKVNCGTIKKTKKLKEIVVGESEICGWPPIST